MNILIPTNLFPSTALQVHIAGPNNLTQRVTIAVK
jgi:hypothetical protein